MPIVKTTKINEKSAYAIWKITESVEELKVLTNTKNIQLPDISSANKIKQTEWMASRFLLVSLLEKIGYTYSGMYKDQYDKPHLKNLNVQISLSHSFPLVAAIIHLEKAVGIDIEKPRDKLRNIAHKFLSKEEQRICGDDLDLLCIHWCAKEALYKLYGKKKLTFKENLLVRMTGNELYGKIIVNDLSKEYKLQVQKILGSFLVLTK